MPFAPSAAFAQVYPNRPVRFIVPFPPAGNTDVIARAISPKLSDAFGHQVVVDNRGGANTILGAELAARSAPDGHTIFLATATTLSINPVVYRKLPYDADKDFVPITLLCAYPYVIGANAGLAANTIPELVALAKQKPGTITYASAGNGSSGHLGGALLESLAAIRMVHVPYKGTGPAIMDTLAGHVNIVITGISLLAPHVKTGRVKILASGGTKRMPLHPEIPTVAELGYPAYVSNTWFGVVAPTGTPRAIVDRLNREIVRVLEMREVRERLEPQGYDLTFGSPEMFAQYLAEDRRRWARVAKESNVRLD
jgi:tripartite-type tricarboxylate transporter receptor subunit TctC